MKITIIGAGNAGTTVAADLSIKGHDVTLLKTSKAMHNENFEYIKKTKSIDLIENNETMSAHISYVTQEYETAINTADVLILYIQTNFHQNIIKKISQYMHDGQTVIIEPGYLSTCYFLKHCPKKITIIEAESSPIDCRIIKPGVSQVLFRNVLNPFGVYPKANIGIAQQVLDQLKFPYTFTDHVIEAALHNPNLIVHTVGGIMSFHRIEYSQGNYWMYREVFTPTVWNIVEQLDQEKMNILEKVGCNRLSYVEACKKRNSVDDTRDAWEVFQDYAHNSSPAGPHVTDSRYITEDVSQGLVLLESLGKILNIPTPICTALIEIASAAIQRPFRQEGRTIEELGLKNLQQVIQNG